MSLSKIWAFLSCLKKKAATHNGFLLEHNPFLDFNIFFFFFAKYYVVFCLWMKEKVYYDVTSLCYVSENIVWK